MNQVEKYKGNPVSKTREETIREKLYNHFSDIEALIGELFLSSKGVSGIACRVDEIKKVLKIIPDSEMELDASVFIAEYAKEVNKITQFQEKLYYKAGALLGVPEERVTEIMNFVYNHEKEM